MEGIRERFKLNKSSTEDLANIALKKVVSLKTAAQIYGICSCILYVGMLISLNVLWYKTAKVTTVTTFEPWATAGLFYKTFFVNGILFFICLIAAKLFTDVAVPSSVPNEGFSFRNWGTGYGIYTTIITVLSLIAGIGATVVDFWAWITYIWWWSAPEYAAMFGITLAHSVMGIIYLGAVVIFGVLGMFLGAAQRANIPLSKKMEVGNPYTSMEDVIES